MGVLIAVSGQAWADIPLSEYRKNRASFVKEGELYYYLLGVGTGIYMTSTYATIYGSKPIFCPSGRLVFDSGMIMSIITNYLDRKSGGDAVPIELLAISAFADAFPCGK